MGAVLGGGFGSSGRGRWLSLGGPRPAWSSSISSSMLSSPSVGGHADRHRSEGLGRESLKEQMTLGARNVLGLGRGRHGAGWGWSSPEAVEVEAWSSSGWPVCRSTRSISSTSIHWLSSCLSSASRCCVAIFSRARRSISCSYSFSFLFRDWRTEPVTARYPEWQPRGPRYHKHLPPLPSPPDHLAPRGSCAVTRGPGGRGLLENTPASWSTALPREAQHLATVGPQAGVDPGQSLPYSHINSVLRGFAASCPIHRPGGTSLHSAEQNGKGNRFLSGAQGPHCHSHHPVTHGWHKLPSMEPMPQRSPDDPALLSPSSFTSLLNFNTLGG